MSKVTWGDVVSIIGIFLVFLLVMGACLSSCGCVSAPPGSRAGISFSLVSIQLGGTQSSVDVLNYVQGTNVTQKHRLPMDLETSDPTTVSLPLVK